MQFAQDLFASIGRRQDMFEGGIRKSLGIRPKAAQQLHTRPLHGGFQFMAPGTIPVVFEAGGVGLRVVWMLDKAGLCVRIGCHAKHLVLQPDKLLAAHAVQPLRVGFEPCERYFFELVGCEIRLPQALLPTHGSNRDQGIHEGRRLKHSGCGTGAARQGDVLRKVEQMLQRSGPVVALPGFNTLIHVNAQLNHTG